MLDFSSSWVLKKDRHGLFKGDKLYRQLKNTIFNHQLHEKTHIAKFHVWKTSMHFRTALEFGFVVVLTLFFQYYISGFNQDLHIAIKEAQEITAYRKDPGSSSLTEEEYKFLDADFHEELDKMSAEISHAL